MRDANRGKPGVHLVSAEVEVWLTGVDPAAHLQNLFHSKSSKRPSLPAISALGLAGHQDGAVAQGVAGGALIARGPCRMKSTRGRWDRSLRASRRIGVGSGSGNGTAPEALARHRRGSAQVRQGRGANRRCTSGRGPALADGGGARGFGRSRSQPFFAAGLLRRHHWPLTGGWARTGAPRRWALPITALRLTPPSFFRDLARGHSLFSHIVFQLTDCALPSKDMQKIPFRFDYSALQPVPVADRPNKR